MLQQDFDSFKLRLKEWREAYPEEYSLFEEEMNSKDAVGYQKILNLAITLVPAYKKIINQKANQGTFDDVSDIENLFAGNQLAQTLLGEFENPHKNSIISNLHTALATPFASFPFFSISIRKYLDLRSTKVRIKSLPFCICVVLGNEFYFT